MKIKIAILYLSLIAILDSGVASAETGSKPSEPFHVAQTPAEKTLDDILRRVVKTVICSFMCLDALGMTQKSYRLFPPVY